MILKKINFFFEFSLKTKFNFKLLEKTFKIRSKKVQEHSQSRKCKGIAAFLNGIQNF